MDRVLGYPSPVTASRRRLIEEVRRSLWALPVTCAVAGAVLSMAVGAIDRRAGFDILPGNVIGGPDVAIAILSTVAYSMVSLAALVLTITMVVVQLAMGQFSPRIVQTFLQDKPSQIAIGLFVATFTSSIVALRSVDADAGTVPELSIVVTLVMVLLSIIVLAVYVHHIGQSLRVAALIELVGDKTRDLLDRVYPADGSSGGGAPDVVCAPESGVVTFVDREALVGIAERHDARIELVAAIGDFVPSGAALARIVGGDGAIDHADVVGCVDLRIERSLDHDVAYGIRMLVDIAERSLGGGGFQDPTTAVQAIDRIHDCLRQLAGRPFPSPVARDADGRIRVVVPQMDWDAYVHLAFDEIRLAGAGSPQVSRRLRAALEDLVSVAPADRRGALREQLELLASSTVEAHDDSRDVVKAQTADSQGLGIEAGAGRS